MNKVEVDIIRGRGSNDPTRQQLAIPVWEELRDKLFRPMVVILKVNLASEITVAVYEGR